MGLNKWFDKGISPNEYMKTLETHEEAFLHIYRQYTLPIDETFFQAVQEKKLRVLVLAEPWCGHCMLNIPILLHLTEKANMPVHFLHRDENLALMDQYLTNGKSRTIPIFIFIDENGNEVAKWGPIANTTSQFMDLYKKELPPKDAEDYKEKFTELITFTAREFRNNKTLWNGVYESIKATLTKAL